jgi:hypothetical protein
MGKAKSMVMNKHRLILGELSSQLGVRGRRWEAGLTETGKYVPRYLNLTDWLEATLKGRTERPLSGLEEADFHLAAVGVVFGEQAGEGAMKSVKEGACGDR